MPAFTVYVSDKVFEQLIAEVLKRKMLSGLSKEGPQFKATREQVTKGLEIARLDGAKAGNEYSAKIYKDWMAEQKIKRISRMGIAAELIEQGLRTWALEEKTKKAAKA